MFRDIQRAGYTTAQIGKLHWTSGPGWNEHFKNSGAYFKALGLDYVVDVSGPPDSTKGRDPLRAAPAKARPAASRGR